MKKPAGWKPEPLTIESTGIKALTIRASVLANADMERLPIGEYSAGGVQEP